MAGTHQRLLQVFVVLLLCGLAGPGCSEDAADPGEDLPAVEVSDIDALSAGPDGASPEADLAGDSEDAREGRSLEGTLSVLTYNIAGLPKGISKSNPEEYIPQISPLLNGYDLVLVQEDFAYHAELVAEADHPCQSIPFAETHGEETVGDGLNRLAVHPFGPLARIPWPGCNGLLECSSDCLATKGFSVARHDLAPGLRLDVYNLHNEAGHCPEDFPIREESMSLLLETIAERSTGVPVLVGGDFNLHADDPVDLEQLMRLVDVEFVDSCWAVECQDERIDRVFLRDGGGIALVPQSWEVPTQFVDEEGRDLSDHQPVAILVEFAPHP